MSDDKPLKAFYRCKRCELENIFVTVRERRADEFIGDYVNAVAAECGAEHERRSPHCAERKIDLGLPTLQNGIGFAGPELMEQDRADVRKQLEKK